MQQPGAEGGAAAQLVSFNDMNNMLHELPEAFTSVTADEVKEDIDAFKHEVWRLRLWRVAPQDSIIAELLRTAMFPNW
eukprot:2040413-Pyramimonas_sp.AAC.1